MPSSTNLVTEVFNYQGTYPCPVCRLGQIKSLPLMDAMACDSCPSGSPVAYGGSTPVGTGLTATFSRQPLKNSGESSP